MGKACHLNLTCRSSNEICADRQTFITLMFGFPSHICNVYGWKKKWWEGITDNSKSSSYLFIQYHFRGRLSFLLSYFKLSFPRGFSVFLCFIDMILFYRNVLLFSLCLFFFIFSSSYPLSSLGFPWYFLAKNAHNKSTNQLLFPQKLWIKYLHRLPSLLDNQSKRKTIPTTNTL